MPFGQYGGVRRVPQYISPFGPFGGKHFLFSHFHPVQHCSGSEHELHPVVQTSGVIAPDGSVGFHVEVLPGALVVLLDGGVRAHDGSGIFAFGSCNKLSCTGSSNSLLVFGMTASTSWP
jgi:hypothetical protein